MCVTRKPGFPNEKANHFKEKISSAILEFGIQDSIWIFSPFALEVCILQQSKTNNSIQLPTFVSFSLASSVGELCWHNP
jgi:hypothetical protein